ncbi:MAG: 4Fe-4S dicluster domain-containing protein [Actinobacteria bacterium]|nr:4Fe-4S dicluster domain-containing protein [Actinomycetota bacterium]
MRPVVRDFFTSFGNMFRKPGTVIYPREKIIIPENSRGIPRLKLNLDTLEIICNGCGICEKICPQKCIGVKKAQDENGKEFLDEFYLDLSTCIFCGNCVEFCDLDAIEMTYRHQLADSDIESFKLEKMDLIKQADYTIRDFWLK